MFGSPSAIDGKLNELESHLQQENPVLLEAVQSFRQLDSVARRIGLLDADESYAAKVPWWPLISVLGTFSSGKSTFLNAFIGYNLQATGNQAVDDKFTVMSYSSDEEPRVLPGLALDADPRFPFYRISSAIEEVAAGEGRRIDSYLQLKVCASDALRGKIFIDSPGFDADEQRTSILRITDHIINLSDLVLVFFDARHPEPGAMQDTLHHLISDTIRRPDANKFLYILNQIDTTAREDNPEEVIAAWQRALAQKGLTAGKFYRIYNKEAAVPIEDDSVRRRFEMKRDEDMAEISTRIEQVSDERAYRIVAVLEQTANAIGHDDIPRLRELIAGWRNRVIATNAVLLLITIGLLTWISTLTGAWDGLHYQPSAWLSKFSDDTALLTIFAGGAFAIALYVHFSVRGLFARRIAGTIAGDDVIARGMRRAFLRNTRWWRSLFSQQPRGWGGRARKNIARVIQDAHQYVQKLNDSFTDKGASSTD